MKTKIISSIAVLAVTPFSIVDGRSWLDLDIPAIESIRNDDPLYSPGSTLLIEDTSLYGSFKLVASEDRSIDVSTPSTTTPNNSSSDDEIQLVGDAPLSLSDQPTFSPSKHYEALNGSCPSNHNLFRLWLYDSVGDGWGSTKLTIKDSVEDTTIFMGTLHVNYGVVKYDTDASLASTHNKNSRRDRQLDMTLGGTISGPSGSITWDANGNVVYGPGGEIDHHTKASSGSSNANGFANTHHENTPDSGTIDGSSGSITWGDPNANRIDRIGSDNAGENDDEEEGSSTYYNEYVYLCLKQDVCYTAEVSGGTFLEETSWEITRVELGTGDNVGLVASGVGDGLGVCSFSLDDSCERTCDGTAQVLQPSGSPTTPSPSKRPSSSPVGTPTISPSIYITKKPAAELRMDPKSPTDSRYAHGAQEYIRLQSLILNASPSSKQVMLAKDSEYQAFDANEESAQFRAFEWVYNSEANGISDEQIVQRWVLASFYYATNGDGWVDKTGWLEPMEHECQWYGVTCLDGKVAKLELKQNRLVGEIIPEITLFASTLYVLSLGNDYDAAGDKKNELVMPLPSFLSDLPSLSYLNLENVGLTSSIPKDLFSSWTHLESLYLNGNDITGTLPQSIKHLSSIEVMMLGGNNIGGRIISEVGELVSLKVLSLENNFRKDVPGKRGFITSVPAEIGQLTNLESLNLADNALSGLVPQLSNLISLRRLQLSGNFFEGQLPPALSRLEMLEELDISFNWLSSTIPPEYGNMISLTSLSLQSNYNDEQGYFTWGIKGKLPSELGQLKNLQYLNLNDNYITGTLITELGQLYSLKMMHLQNNFMQGPIPKEYSSCSSLKEILLQDNDIDGESFSMPDEICRLPQLNLARVDCDVACTCCLSTC